jgi:hypothetical protein
MKNIFAISLALVFSTSISPAAELQPFDRLGRSNLTLHTSAVAGGASTQNDFKTNYGSYDKTKNQKKDIQVEIRPVSSNKSPITLRFYFVFRDAATKEEYFIPCDPVIFDQGSGTARFSETATSNDLKLVMIDIREKSGETIYGWLVRAIRDDTIVGIAGSNERFIGIAQDPRAFKE